MADKAATWEDIADFIQDAARQMREFGLTTLDVEHDGSRVRIRIRTQRTVRSEESNDAVDVQPALSASVSSETGKRNITSPMIGTYYASPGPGQPVFVKEGDEVEVGQVVGIIEAMKIMNEITSEFDGVISRILVKNAQAVEYGQPLLEIQPIDE